MTRSKANKLPAFASRKKLDNLLANTKFPGLTIGLFTCMQQEIWGRLSMMAKQEPKGLVSGNNPDIDARKAIVKFIMNLEDSQWTASEFESKNNAGALLFSRTICASLPSCWETAIINRLNLTGDQALAVRFSDENNPSFYGVLRAFASTFPQGTTERACLKRHALAKTLPTPNELKKLHAEWSKVMESFAIAQTINQGAVASRKIDKSRHFEADGGAKMLGKQMEETKAEQQKGEPKPPENAPTGPAADRVKRVKLTKGAAATLKGEKQDKQPGVEPKETPTAPVPNVTRRQKFEGPEQLASSGKLSLLPHVQHYILSRVQQRLEICLFDFLNCRVPDFVAHCGWSSPVSLELNNCMQLLLSYKPTAVMTSGINLTAWRVLTHDICSIRHNAVHRRLMDNDQLIALMSRATEFVETCLCDDDLALLLKRLRLLISEKDYQLAADINSLQQSSNRRRKTMVEEGEIVVLHGKEIAVTSDRAAEELKRLDNELNEHIDDLQMVVSLEASKEARLLFL